MKIAQTKSTILGGNYKAILPFYWIDVWDHRQTLELLVVYLHGCGSYTTRYQAKLFMVPMYERIIYLT